MILCGAQRSAKGKVHTYSTLHFMITDHVVRSFIAAAGGQLQQRSRGHLDSASIALVTTPGQMMTPLARCGGCGLA